MLENFFSFFSAGILAISEKMCTFALAIENYAQMAESVDALVSNTSGVTSIPVRPRVWVLQTLDNRLIIKGFSFYRAY